MVIGVLLGVLGACLIGCAAGAIVVWAGRTRSPLALPQPPDTNEIVTRLLEANRALLEQERLRASSELDGKKGLIDQQLVSMTGELGKRAVFSGISAFPLRVKCATLPWHALKAALERAEQVSTE